MKEWYSHKSFTSGRWSKAKIIWLLEHLLELNLLGWPHRDGLDGTSKPSYTESEGHIPVVGQARLYDYTWESQRIIRGVLDKKLSMVRGNALYLLAHYTCGYSIGEIAKLCGLDKNIILNKIDSALEIMADKRQT